MIARVVLIARAGWSAASCLDCILPASCLDCILPASCLDSHTMILVVISQNDASIRCFQVGRISSKDADEETSPTLLRPRLLYSDLTSLLLMMRPWLTGYAGYAAVLSMQKSRPLSSRSAHCPLSPPNTLTSTHPLTTHSRSRSTVFYCYCCHLIFLFLIYWFTCVGRGRLLRVRARDGWTSSTMWERTFCWRACSLRTNLIP